MKINQEFIQKVSTAVGENNIYLDEPMGNHTTFKIGGAADVFATPETCDALINVLNICNESEVPYTVIGNGSNLLVSDAGVDGVVICSEKIDYVNIEEDLIVSGCGSFLSSVANAAAKNSLSGLEFASGIPGTVGGGTYMNAGAYGGELKDVIETVTVLDENGNKKVFKNSECGFGYRRSIFSNGYIILEVSFRMQKGNKEEIISQMQELNKRRRDKQPLEYPSAGSTFKRPEGYFAAKLIEDCGLKGFSVGGAKVSEKHSGFVVNAGDATAKDVLELINHIKTHVAEKFNVTLQEEIKLIGR